MATIKDVAQRAGVSVGTVSNVINGKTKNTELIERVENAVEELGFRPDGKARSLKSTQTHLIGVLMGSLREAGSRTMLSAVERCVQKKGYSIIVKITDNNAILERKYMENFLQMGVDGVIVDTGVVRKKWLDMPGLDKLPVVFMEQRPDITREMGVVCIDYERGIRDFLTWCRAQNKQHVGLILRDGMTAELLLERLCTEKEKEMLVSYRLTGQDAPGNGFKSAYELLCENGEKGIDMFLAGSQELAKGILQAADILGYKDDIRLACVKNENWLEDSQTYDCILDVSFQKVGDMAAEKLLERIEAKEKRKMDIEVIHANFVICDVPRRWPGRGTAGVNSINIAILDLQTANVLRFVSPVYERKTGIKIKLQSLSYHDLWHLAGNPEALAQRKLDAVMYDMVWKEEFVRQGVLAPLGELEEEGYMDGYIEKVLPAYGICDGVLYGLPLLTGTQLLFCQKDLFEDTGFQRQFQQRYEYPLAIPGTWDEFLDVAEFFTQKYNPRSPVRYGTAMVNAGNLYNSIQFLNFLWAMGGEVTDSESFCVDTPVTRIALEKYCRTFAYTDQAERKSWEDVADCFKTGNAAMVILYDSYAFGINDPMSSRVAGNVESAILPGKSPVLGGWGLGCVRESANFLLAREFIKWVCGPECDNLFSVLSGISSRKPFYLNRDLDSLYPWKKDILESYAISRKRSMVAAGEKSDVNMAFYDEIMGQELSRIIKGQCSIEEGIRKMETRAGVLFRENKKRKNIQR